MRSKIKWQLSALLREEYGWLSQRVCNTNFIIDIRIGLGDLCDYN